MCLKPVITSVLSSSQPIPPAPTASTRASATRRASSGLVAPPGQGLPSMGSAAGMAALIRKRSADEQDPQDLRANPMQPPAPSALHDHNLVWLVDFYFILKKSHHPVALPHQSGLPRQQGGPVHPSRSTLPLNTAATSLNPAMPTSPQCLPPFTLALHGDNGSQLVWKGPAGDLASLPGVFAGLKTTLACRCGPAPN